MVENISSENNPDNVKDCIVVSEKTVHKGYMFGTIANGGSLIDMGNGYALKVIALNDTFRILQLIRYGIGKAVRTQSWVRSKPVQVQKTLPKPSPEPVKPIQITNNVSVEELI